jgi:2,3-bisphosphoglycerate-independent phosphoglycerate mutase
MKALFPSLSFPNVLGEVLSSLGLRQLRIAETEKYAHVTFFFNWVREEPFAGEEHILVPSPHVATYDLLPEMSAKEVTKQVISGLDRKEHNFVIVNYANANMVGHTGNLEATKQAIEVIDLCLGQLEKASLAHNGTLIITADHGNAEIMIDPETRQSHTAHTSSPVPFILINPIYKSACLRAGPQGGALRAPALLLMRHPQFLICLVFLLLHK